jgi:hypothetical protein
MSEQEPWHLDRKVPIAFIIIIAGQIGLGAYWVSNVDNRLATEVATNLRQEAKIEELRNETQGLSVAAASVAANLQALSASLNEVKEAQKETNALLRDLANKGQ